MLKNIGLTEIVVIAIVLLVLFGGKKLPELARGIGESIKIFRRAFSGEDEKKDKEPEGSE